VAVQRPKRLTFEFPTLEPQQPDTFTLHVGPGNAASSICEHLSSSGALQEGVTAQVVPEEDPPRGVYPERIVVDSPLNVAAQIAVLNAALDSSNTPRG
jgi:hypothetical protein